MILKELREENEELSSKLEPGDQGIH